MPSPPQTQSGPMRVQVASRSVSGGVLASIEALGGPRLIAWDDPVG